MINLIKMAYRDIGRNRRRSFFSALALGIGLTLLMLMAGVLSWELINGMDLSIRLQTGHLQVTAQSYDESITSLTWADLIQNPDQVAAQIASMPQVADATPRLFASGIVSSGDETIGVRVVGIEPASDANAPYRDGMVSGQYLTADDNKGILVGEALANKMNFSAGDQVTVLVNTSNGSVQQQDFTIRGIYTTHTPSYDQTYVFMPLAKAQALTDTSGHASTIFVLLKDIQQTNAVAAALQSTQYKVLTYEQMNTLLVQFNQYADALLFVLYVIVLAIISTVIVNTLVMSVFERTREIGILAAIGMKSRSIMNMFFFESILLAVGGVAIGMVLGIIVDSLVGKYGIPIGDFGITGIYLGERLYAALTLKDAVFLTITTFVVTLLAALYPASLAARMEPVEALHSAQ
jgi:ABC-type lipoprotein release transport system permease subunit